MITLRVKGEQTAIKAEGSGEELLEDLTRVNIAVLNTMKYGNADSPPIESFYRIMALRLLRLADGRSGADIIAVDKKAFDEAKDGNP